MTPSNPRRLQLGLALVGDLVLLPALLLGPAGRWFEQHQGGAFGRADRVVSRRKIAEAVDPQAAVGAERPKI